MKSLFQMSSLRVDKSSLQVERTMCFVKHFPQPFTTLPIFREKSKEDDCLCGLGRKKYIDITRVQKMIVRNLVPIIQFNVTLKNICQISTGDIFGKGVEAVLYMNK